MLLLRSKLFSDKSERPKRASVLRTRDVVTLSVVTVIKRRNN